MDEKFKLRIKHPSGAEFEAEGAHDFVLKEKESFLRNSRTAAEQRASGSSSVGRYATRPAGVGGYADDADLLSHAPGQQDIAGRQPALQTDFAAKQAKAQEFWQKAIGTRNNLFILKIKSPDISGSEAAFIIMAASQIIGEIKDYSAINLSKSLKTSGYMPQRLDRLLLNEIKAGNIMASGTKRNRTYCLTPKGMQTAYLAAAKLINYFISDNLKSLF
ncbi:MAG: hypothetical protein HY746_06560 [Elusimicrobia bacterium]|nr:hypothetical protein [Elusimicrobiota bacterium]